MRFPDLLLALCLLAGAAAAAWADKAPDPGRERETIHLSSGYWPPYLGEDLPGQGIAGRIINEAMARAGLKVKWEFHPWARAQRMARLGESDGTAAWFPSPQRRKQFLFSEPVILAGAVFFHRKGMDFHWDSPEDLKPYTIGTTISYEYGPLLRQAIEGKMVNVETVSSDLLNLQKLLAGRIDLFPVDRVVGLYLLEKHFPKERAQQITYHPRYLYQDFLHLMFSRELPENPARLARFNKALAELRREGFVEKVLLDVLGDRLVSGR